MNVEDMVEAGLAHGDRVALIGDAADGLERRLGGLSVITFELPRGTIGAYYPECNVLDSHRSSRPPIENPGLKVCPRSGSNGKAMEPPDPAQTALTRRILRAAE